MKGNVAELAVEDVQRRNYVKNEKKRGKTRERYFKR
jgi:hypothetical protein